MKQETLSGSAGGASPVAGLAAGFPSSCGTHASVFWRRRLPHWVPENSVVFVTWRLAGTLPRPAPQLEVRDRRPGKTFLVQDRQLDRAPSGPRWLEDPRIAGLVVDALLYGERVRRAYDLFAWVVMPNHVHLVLKPNGKLAEIMRWLKAATATRANRLLGRWAEPFWQREYFDRWIRSDKEFASVVSYVEANPVTAGLPPVRKTGRGRAPAKAPAARPATGDAPPALPHRRAFLKKCRNKQAEGLLHIWS